jgi:hypothetical protein
VRWLPFFLRKGVPEEGIPKPLDTPDNPRVPPRLRAAGQAVGLNFTGKCDRAPNTLKAHVLLSFCAQQVLLTLALPAIRTLC